MIFFEPTDKFWNYIAAHPWRWKQYHECGAGSGHLSRLMLERGYSVHAYDKYPRGADDETGGKLRVMDTTTEDFGDQFGVGDALIIARPCHNGWIADTLRHSFEVGDAFYVGLPKNFEQDLDDEDLHYEIVADDVGEDREKLIRVYCTNAKAKTLRLIKVDGDREEWWWYRPGLDRYVSEPGGISGFGAGREEVLKELKRGNDIQMGFAKEVLCDDKLHGGWCAPDGEWFGCAERAHDRVALYVIGCTVARLEALGFIRAYGLEYGTDGLWTIQEGLSPTPAQAKMLRRHKYKVRRGVTGGLVSDKEFGT